MSKYTNISTKHVGELDGFPIRPCMKSGFCCTMAPCAFGEYDYEKKQCKYLGEPNDIGQKDCLRYQWILDNVPEEIRNFNPAFGFGCCSPIGNLARNKIIETITINKIT